LELWGLLNMIENDSKDKVSITAENAMPFLRTHPQGETRLANIRKHLPAAMQVYNATQAPTKLEQIKTRLSPGKVAAPEAKAVPEG
jgi:predicted Zn-dependent protease